MNQESLPRFQTEIEFTLPRGYLDQAGVLHRHGALRYATAADEILPLSDPRVQKNPAYLAIIILSRVIVKLGTLRDIDVKIIENLSVKDFNHLQDLYEQLNSGDDLNIAMNGGLASVDDSDSDSPLKRMRTVGES